MTELGFGTYHPSSNLRPLLQYAVERDWSWIDTAPNYGAAQHTIGSLVNEGKIDWTSCSVSSKVGFLADDRERAYLLRSGLITPNCIIHNNVLSPEYVRYRAVLNCSELVCRPLRLLFLHNPEIHSRVIGRESFVDRLRACFAECESLRAENYIEAYGIATWHGLFSTLSLSEIYNLARDGAGANNGFKAIQLPLSLVRSEELKEAVLSGAGPLIEAKELGLQVFGSSPLHGGELPRLLLPGFREPFGADLSSAQVCLQVLRSVGCIDRVLIGCRREVHVDEATALETMDTAPMNMVAELLSMI